jgi:CheY-like chemotaxis protein
MRGWEQGVEITVTDTGIGMTPEQTTHVFEEFTQGDGTITRRFGGTGLGLPIVRQLVRLMRGEISLTSEAMQGTSVQLRLPLPPLAGSGAEANRKARGSFPGKRALVAEDNSTNRLILRAMLARLGINATFVNDGDEVLDAWQPEAFDLLLLDISMPRKDGLTALLELRDKAGSAGLPPAIAVTANAMTHHVQEYRDKGFDAVVAKPLQLDDLAAAIALVFAQEVQS